MTYVTSDLHGEYAAFMHLLDKIAFSPADEMIVCGDVIDKGRDSVRLLQYIMRAPNIEMIIGNHEYAFLNRYYADLRSSPADFDAFLASLGCYFPDDGHLLDWETVDFLENCPAYIEREDFICVHGGLPLDVDGTPLPLAEASVNVLVYDRTFLSPTVLPAGEKCVFFGHTPTSYVCGENKILAYKRRGGAGECIRDYAKVHLDLCSWISGRVGCFCVDTCRTHYATR